MFNLQKVFLLRILAPSKTSFLNQQKYMLTDPPLFFAGFRVEGGSVNVKYPDVLFWARYGMNFDEVFINRLGTPSFSA